MILKNPIFGLFEAKYSGSFYPFQFIQARHISFESSRHGEFLKKMAMMSFALQKSDFFTVLIMKMVFSCLFD